MASDEVGLLHQIGGEDGVLSETEMGFGDPKAFFCIIFKVGLGIEVGIFANDFNRVFVGANCTVGTEAPEFAGHATSTQIQRRSYR